MSITREQLFGTNCERPGERLNFKCLRLHQVRPAALRAPSSHTKTSVCARNKHGALHFNFLLLLLPHKVREAGNSQRARRRREAEDLVNPRGTSKDRLSGPLASAREGRADALTAPRTRKGQEC